MTGAGRLMAGAGSAASAAAPPAPSASGSASGGASLVSGVSVMETSAGGGVSDTGGLSAASTVMESSRVTSSGSAPDAPCRHVTARTVTAAQAGRPAGAGNSQWCVQAAQC